MGACLAIAPDGPPTCNLNTKPCTQLQRSGNEAVIDNERVILLDVLKEILPETKRASIAVGYFFISGFAAIMDSIEKIENGSDPNNVIRFLRHDP